MKHWKRVVFPGSLLVVLIAGLAGCPSSNNNPSSSPQQPVTVQEVYGTITYTGSKGTVGANNPLVISPCATPSFESGLYGVPDSVTSNGVTYVVNPSTDPFFVTAYFAAVTLPSVSGGIPRQGDPYYNFVTGSCNSATTYSLYATYSDLHQDISFGDYCLMSGVSGGVTYTGSYNTATYPVIVGLYKDSAYTTLEDNPGSLALFTNNSVYNIASKGTTDYLEAFVSLNGTDVITTGDPYLRYGAITPSPTLKVNLAFNDSTTY